MSSPDPKPKTQLFCILAREARAGVIFRRGPSRQVLLIKWNLKDDTFEYGQWLKGRIYERRCDLSPSGEKLIYFAANWKDKGPKTWTAVSKPPYLTAIAFAPKGDAWNGGGLFESENSILLNGVGSLTSSDERFKRNVTVRDILGRVGWGEDMNIYEARLKRDGWRHVQGRMDSEPDWKAKIIWEFEPPVVYERKRPKGSKPVVLQMQIKGIHERDEHWYVIDYAVVARDGGELLFLPKTSWANWDTNGDLLFAQQSKLFRLSFSNKEHIALDYAKELADFGLLTFEPKKAPERMTKW